MTFILAFILTLLNFITMVLFAVFTDNFITQSIALVIAGAGVFTYLMLHYNASGSDDDE